MTDQAKWLTFSGGRLVPPPHTVPGALAAVLGARRGAAGGHRHAGRPGRALPQLGGQDRLEPFLSTHWTRPAT